MYLIFKIIIFFVLVKYFNWIKFLICVICNKLESITYVFHCFLIDLFKSSLNILYVFSETFRWSNNVSFHINTSTALNDSCTH